MATSSAAPSSADGGDWEREMSRHQLELVDTCFEEGQYESGISVLEQLRSPQFKPSELHIRQLLYIALYPPPPPELHDKNKDRLKELPTPTKATIRQNQKSTQFPSPQATAAAVRLLTSFVLTNSPGSLGRALPEYGSISEWNARREQNLNVDLGDDSYIAQEAVCIGNARNAWLMLQEGFIQRKSIVSSTPKGKGKKKRKAYEYLEEEPIRFDGDHTTHVTVVAEHAWPVLDWLLMLFESDEHNAEKSSKPRHSSILLSQISPPQSANGCRWDAKAALDIVFYCLEQTDHKRKAMGGRLLTSLVNLTSTIYIDISLFVTSIYTRLVSSATEHSDTFSIFCSMLQPSPTTAKFKVLLCKQYLTATSSVDNAGAPFLSLRPKPQARAIRAIRRSDQEKNITPASTLDVSTAPTSIASKIVPSSASEILQLLERPNSENFPPVQLQKLKFELLISYLTLQNSTLIPEQEVDWKAAVESGQVSRAIDSAFHGVEGSFYKESLVLIDDFNYG